MKKPVLRIASLLLITACSIASADGSAKPKDNPNLYLHFSSDHPDGSYAAGESVTWRIKLTGVSKDKERSITPGYVVKSDKDVIASGNLGFVDGMAQVSVMAAKPGVLVLWVDQETPWRPGFSSAVAVDWRSVKSTVAEPADYDAFWKKKLAELAAVPMNPVLEEVADSGSPEIQLWKITMDGIRGSRIHGYLARPRGTAALPAQLQLQYWGVYPLNKSEVVGIARKGWLAMNIMAHDLPCDRAAAFYKNPGINTYVNQGQDDPDKSYFLRMFLSCSRAVDYLAGRSDWNKGALLVQGGSQGAFQCIASAALNPKVTAVTVFVPVGGNLTGFLDGQPSGWPGWVFNKATGSQREAMIKTAGYYDANNFAKRIRCPVLVGTGLMDTTSYPVTQFTMFNNITAPKRMVLLPEDEHTSAHTAYKAVQAEWCEAAAAGAPVPLK